MKAEVQSQDEQFDIAEREYAARMAELERLQAEEQREKQQRQLARDEARENAAALPPEPVDGISIAVRLPSGRKVMRRFGMDEKTDDLFALIANEDELWSDGTPEFALKCVTWELARGSTFASQNVVHRTLFTCEVGSG
jgi:hypothetical protein